MSIKMIPVVGSFLPSSDYVQMTDTELLDTKEMLRLKQDANEYADGILSRLQRRLSKITKKRDKN